MTIVKKNILIVLVILILGQIFSINVFAQMGTMMDDFGSLSDNVEQESEHHETVDEVLNEIIQTHNVSNIQDLDCVDLSEDEFERLGDAQMEIMHPGESHERMDNMMGGEGSESLKQMHIAMGQGYLGCSTRYSGGMGMMGSMGMMRNWRNNSNNGSNGSNYWENEMYPMMNNWGMMPTGVLGFGGLSMLILWVVIIVVVILLVMLLRIQNITVSSRDTTSLNILKTRYAKGEISKNEFESIKNDIH